MKIKNLMTDDGRVLDERFVSGFPACKADPDVQRANVRKYLYGDAPGFRRSHLTSQIDERMRQLNVAVISRQLLEQTIGQLETTLAMLIDELDRLDRLDQEARHAMDG